MERITKSKWFRGLVLALTVTIAGFVLAACGGGHEEKEGLFEGEIVEVGSLEYQVLFSRPLNKNDVEDSEYLVGKPEPAADEMYVGVFISIRNEGDEPAQIPEHFDIRTTSGKTYSNLRSKSIYALEPGATIQPHESLPKVDSPAQVGPIGGAMLLYLIKRSSAEERPVELIIEGDHEEATFDLDL